MALQGDAVTGKFNEMLSSPSILVITMLLITIAGFLICSVGLQNGVERVTKVMMIVLMVVMIFLAVYSFTMPGAKEGLKFYLVPDKQQIEQVGLFHIITSAMSQAFFTLSLGIGAMLIFGSYLNGGKSLLGEASQHCSARYVCSDYRRPHHFPGVLLLSTYSRTAARS